MKTREEAVACAMTWMDTPYIKGARVRGAGCDCETLIEAYLIEVGAAEEIVTGLYSGDWFCHANREIYFEGLSKYAACTWQGQCLGTPPVQPGDIAIFRAAGSKVYNHGCIITGWPRALHSFDVGVRESRPALHPLTAYMDMAVFDPWQK